MYMPKLHQEDNLATLHGLMRDYSFATLVTQHDGAPFATHLPLVLEADEGPYGTLYGHIARANPQWQDFHETQEVLVIFQGPHTYVSPSWYEVELSVPTWNYTAVHAYGTPHLVTDYEAFYALLDTLVQTHEAHFEKPWPFQLPGEYLQKMMQGIVGFEIHITRLEGKFKLSQNRTASEREKVIAALQNCPDTPSAGVAELMRNREK